MHSLSHIHRRSHIGLALQFVAEHLDQTGERLTLELGLRLERRQVVLEHARADRDAALGERGQLVRESDLLAEPAHRVVARI
jgi:hypothetical protein